MRQFDMGVRWKLLEALGITNESSNRFFWRWRIILLDALPKVVKNDNDRVEMIGLLGFHFMEALGSRLAIYCTETSHIFPGNQHTTQKTSRYQPLWEQGHQNG
jgi:hypothetical protein